jgi:hypothetical protein
MLRLEALVRTDVSEELSAYFIRFTRIGELGTMLEVTSNRRSILRYLPTPNLILSSPILVRLMMVVIRSSEILVLRRAIRRNIPVGVILQFRGVIRTASTSLV